ncbi:hypothetical protein D3C73_713590 [compost metagenome]
MQRIGSGLPGDDRLTFARALALSPMAGGAGGDPARRVAGQPDRRQGAGRILDGGRGQSGVPDGHGAAGARIQAARHAGHDVVRAQTAGVVLHLFLQIALIQTGQARRRNAVAFALQAMTGEAGVGRTARAAAHGDDLA